MCVMNIRCFPDKALRKKGRDVNTVGEEETKILADMAQTMYIKGGVGLAAIQVGIDRNLIVIDIGEGLLKLINPVIIHREGSESQEEGCLSVPDTCVKVKRAKKITLNYLDDSGAAAQLSAEGLLARVIQHEVDHLFGRIILDYLSPLKKMCNSLTIRKL